MRQFGLISIIFAWTFISENTGFSLDLCAYFIHGGTCQGMCEFEAVHSWGIPLCSHAHKSTSKCCIPPSHPLLKRKTTSSPITTTPSTPQPSTQESVPTMQSDSTSFSSTCGVSRRTRVRRVVGGRRASSGSWPWQVAIQQYTGEYMCGGVILNEKWVLTAAHCFQPAQTHPQYVRVYVGNQKLQYDKGRRNNSKTIARIIQHPDFQRNVASISTDPATGMKQRYTRHLHDLALLELGTSLEYSNSIKPICLDEEPRADDRTGNQEDCWVTGWGKGAERETDRELQEVSGKAMNYTKCGQRWGTSFNNDVICFGGEDRGPCKGDSGSGLYCRHSNGRFHLAGIVSWGRDDCEHDKHPSVLMNVEFYWNWLNSVMNPLQT